MSILTDFFDYLSNKKCENCYFARDAFFEFFRKTQDQNEQYARVVTSIGYVSYITLLSMLRDVLLNSNTKICYFYSIIFISLSLALFVGFEIWKVKSTNNYEKNLIDKIKVAMDKSPDFSLSDLKNEIIKARETAYSNIEKATNCIFTVSVICAIISAFCFMVCIGFLLT